MTCQANLFGLEFDSPRLHQHAGAHRFRRVREQDNEMTGSRLPGLLGRCSGFGLRIFLSVVASKQLKTIHAKSNVIAFPNRPAAMQLALAA